MAEVAEVAESCGGSGGSGGSGGKPLLQCSNECSNAQRWKQKVTNASGQKAENRAQGKRMCTSNTLTTDFTIRLHDGRNMGVASVGLGDDSPRLKPGASQRRVLWRLRPSLVFVSPHASGL